MKVQIRHVCLSYFLDASFPAPFDPGPIPSQRSVITTTGSTCCVFAIDEACCQCLSLFSCLWQVIRHILVHLFIQSSIPRRGCRKWAVIFDCFVPHLHMVYPHSQPWLSMTKIRFLYNSTKLGLEKEPDWISPYNCNLSVKMGIAADLYQK